MNPDILWGLWSRALIISVRRNFAGCIRPNTACSVQREAEVNFISRYCGPHIAERIQPPRLMVSQSIVPKTSLPAYSFFVSSVTAQTWNLECKPICRTFPDLSATVGTDGGFPLPTRLCRDSHWGIICLQSATADDLGLFQATKIPFVFRPQFKNCARPFGGRYIVAARPRPGIYIRTALVIPACGRTTGSLSQPFIAARYKATHSQLFLQHPLLFPRHDFLGFTEVLNRNHRPAILQESDHPSNHRRTR